ncbi:MAG: DUF368 domain-containing protein [Clostridia bacterium]|nr:DUF368 domain-containing protein [Clostridia bacterium]
MKEFILDVVKGMLIGVANVIPGVSGGTIAVSTGVYEKIIDAINNIRKEFKQSVKTLFPFVVGIIIGIIALAFVITFLLNNEIAKVPTTACFIGLVLGGVPMLHNKIKDEKLKWTHIVAFIITLAIIIVPAAVAVNTKPIDNMELNAINVIILGMLGVISAAAMVVPGVSGSMILMMLGYYDYVIGTIKNTISELVHFNFTDSLNGIIVMIPFAIGVLLGIIIITKIISTILKRWPNASTWGILGLVVASPFAIIVKIGTVTINPLIVILSVITFIVGYFISNKLGEK